MSESSNVGRWSAIVTLILFFLSNLAVISPMELPVPPWLDSPIVVLLRRARLIPPVGTLKTMHLRLDFITVPLFSVLLLLAVGAIDGTVVRRGIIGADGIQPINILALFISLAYISISLDFTGLLRFSAFWVARKGGTSGRRLYFYFYMFFLLCGTLVGNDPVILSGTAFLAYFTRVSGITPPTAWIFSQFTAANMASVVLVSSNPTNLVLSGAFSLSFISYTGHVIVPFLAAAILVYPILVLVLFRSPDLIPLSLEADLGEAESGSAALVDKAGAIFGSVLLLITLSVLVGTSTVGVPVWEVTVPAAVIMLLRDTYHDVIQFKRSLHDPIPEGQDTGVYPLQILHQRKSRETQISGQPPQPTEEGTTYSEPTPVLAGDLTSTMKNFEKRVTVRLPTVTTILSRLPVSLVPFAFLMFILVQGLAAQGWVELFAGWWTTWVNHTGVLGAIGGMAFISCILCNTCGTNIGATILLARVIQLWIQRAESNGTTSIDVRIREGAIYALALGSNYGAFTLTFSASLAGLLWRQILRQKGIHVRPRQFLVLNFPIAFGAMLASSATLAAQIYVIHRNTDDYNNQTNNSRR